jgi:deoxyadenosine/deoxycytidine kinase
VYKISRVSAACSLNLKLKNTDFMGLHIAVAGNIGAGKTTLVTKLAKHYGWEAHFEAVDENPYLSDFYQDMSKWSFPLQIYFLHSRFNQVRSIRESGNTIIQDRTIYEDAYIFARNLRDSGFLTKRDFENYFSLFQSMTSVIQPPDLLIYLRASIPKLTEQISKRGRDYEASISIGYLEDLNRHYETWIGDYRDGKLLIVDVNNTDFVRNPEDLHEVVKRIDADLHGLFSDPNYKRASMFTAPEIL